MRINEFSKRNFSLRDAAGIAESYLRRAQRLWRKFSSPSASIKGKGKGAYT